jgi:hypothetical protein
VKYDANEEVISINSHILNAKTPPKFFVGEPID